jgi:hypothetical protein
VAELADLDNMVMAFEADRRQLWLRLGEYRELLVDIRAGRYGGWRKDLADAITEVLGDG